MRLSRRLAVWTGLYWAALLVFGRTVGPPSDPRWSEAGFVALLLSGFVFVVQLWWSGRRRRRLLGLTLSQIDGLSGPEFEEWVALALERSRIPAVVVGGTGDFGVDVVADVAGHRVAVQAKRSGRNVGNRAVQEAIAGATYHDCQLAAVVTQAEFTPAAREQAARAVPPTLLVARDDLPVLGQALRDFVGTFGGS